MATGFSLPTRDLIRERAMDYNGVATCEVLARCQGLRVASEIHHRRGRGMGSTRRLETNLAANGLACCHQDHQWITEHPKEAYRYGWLLKQHQTPSSVPLLRRGRWVVFDDLGGIHDAPGSAVMELLGMESA